MRLEDYTEIIENIVRKHHKHYRKDLRQECKLVLLEMEQKYSGGLEYFKPTAIMRMDGHCKNYLDRENNRIISEGECSLDSMNHDEDLTGESRVNNLDSGYDLGSELDVRSHIEHITPKYSIRDMRVLELTMQGYTARDIEECFPELEVKERTVYNILKRFEDDSI